MTDQQSRAPIYHRASATIKCYPSVDFSLIRLDEPGRILFQCAHHSSGCAGNKDFPSPRTKAHEQPSHSNRLKKPPAKLVIVARVNRVKLIFRSVYVSPRMSAPLGIDQTE